MKRNIIRLNWVWISVVVALSASFPVQAQSSGHTRGGAPGETVAGSPFESRRNLPAYIEAAKAANSDDSRRTLLQIALDKDIPERHALAAGHAFRSTATSKLEAAHLVDSPHESVRELGLLHLLKASLDRATWETKLLPLVRSGTVRDKERLVVIAQLDKGPVPAKEKAAALLRACEGIESAPGHDRLVGYDHWLGPNYQLVYRYLVDALVQMDDLNLEDLAELTPDQPGPIRDCVLIARVAKGDATVRQAVRTMALKHPQYLLKARAVRAFVSRGTEEDLPVLEEVARTDSLCVTNKYTDGIWPPKFVYPLREEAKYGMTNILRRAGSK